MESFVRNVLLSLIFSMSVSFIEWSDEPVATVSMSNQQTALMASLWMLWDVTKGRFLAFVFFFFFLSVFTSLSSFSRKSSGTFQILRSPKEPALQMCPSSPGLKSVAKTEPSWALMEMTSTAELTPNFDTLSSSSIPPEIT